MGFLDGIMLSSTRDIAPSCIENVDELIERQEKSLSQLDAKKSIVTDLIAKGKVILQNPDKPKFLEGNVRELRRVGMTQRRRHKTDFNSSMKPRMLSLVMLKTMKQLLQNLKLRKRKLRRLRKCSTLKLLMLTSRRDKTFSRRALTLLMGSLILSMPIWLPCPSQFLRTRRKLLQRKLQLLRKSLRLTDALPPQSRRLRTLLLILLLLTTPSRQLIHGKMLQQLSLQTSRKLLGLCSLRIELQEQWISRKTLQPSLKF